MHDIFVPTAKPVMTGCRMCFFGKKHPVYADDLCQLHYRLNSMLKADKHHERSGVTLFMLDWLFLQLPNVSSEHKFDSTGKSCPHCLGEMTWGNVDDPYHVMTIQHYLTQFNGCRFGLICNLDNSLEAKYGEEAFFNFTLGMKRCNGQMKGMKSCGRLLPITAFGQHGLSGAHTRNGRVLTKDELRVFAALHPRGAHLWLRWVCKECEKAMLAARRKGAIELGRAS